MKIEVVLNGTDKNPWHIYGLKMNPFPMTGLTEYAAAEQQVKKLGADPIPNADYIRETLRGFKPEFIDLCVARFTPGSMVTFMVEWKD